MKTRLFPNRFIKFSGTIVLIIFFFGPSSSFAQKKQEVNAPAALTDSLNGRFMKLSGVKWYQDDEFQYSAEFKYNKTNTVVLFTREGEWLESKTEVDSKELPSKINSYIKGKYLNDPALINKLNTVFLIEQPNETFYMALVKLHGSKDDAILTFKSTGDLIKETVPPEYLERKAQTDENDGKSIDDMILKDDDF
ncbi:MAG: PepSY-like domain-containing protein [Bacteroidetes bacterium]|nr:PepSY-like domain-containing protein [Bacteroidota bacterium]MBU1717723.1 PepSY-like domain-containing protein [Bacteroidota bacterium]